MSDNSQKPESAIQNSVLDKVIEFFTGLTSIDRIKVKKLKEINSNVQKHKYKFYNYKKDLINPQFGAYIYDIYRISQNFANHFNIKVRGNSIKEFIITKVSSSEQHKISEELSPEKIRELLLKADNKKQAVEKIKELLQKYVKEFDTESVRTINTTFNQISDFSNLINFDWYFLVHKFDSNIYEGNFNYKPNFETLDSKYVIEELIPLVDYLYTIDFNKDFKFLLTYIQESSDDKSLAQLFKKLIQLFRNLKRDDLLFDIVKLVQKDPFFEYKKFPSDSRIVQDYISIFQNSVQKTVQETLKEIEKDRINKLLMDIFRTTIIVRLKFYTQTLNEMLLKSGFSGFGYIEPMNYLKAFLLDFCKGELKKRLDHLIIKGEWQTPTLSSEYSSLLDIITKLSDEVIEFDNKCSDDERYGKEIKKLSHAAKHEPKAKQLLRQISLSVDNDAQKLIFESIKVLSIFLGKLKLLYDDYTLKVPKMIINFHKIKWDFGNDFNEDFSEVLKKISSFINLMKNYVKDQNTPAKGG